MNCPPRLDLVPHQHREDLIGRRGVLERHPLQGPGRRVHRRLPKLVGVHLAEALEPGQLRTVLGQVHHGAVQVDEGERLLAAILQRDLERRSPNLLQQGAVDIGEAPVVVVLEEGLGQVVGAGQAAAAVDRLDHQLALSVVDQLGVERLRGGALRGQQLAGPGDARDPLVEQLGLLEEAHQVGAELGLQRGGPALVLLGAAHVALPAALGQLLRACRWRRSARSSRAGPAAAAPRARTRARGRSPGCPA